MRSRPDLLLYAGVAAALLIIFSAPLSRAVEYTRRLEQQSGLNVLPALLVLTTVFVIHLLLRRHEVRTTAAAARAVAAAAEHRAQELQALVDFGQALGRSVDRETLRSAAAQHLPRLAGSDRVWVLLRHTREWEPLVADPRGDDHAQQMAFAAETIDAATPLASDRYWGLPLTVSNVTIGVLGVHTAKGALDDDRRAALGTAATMLAVSWKNAELVREGREHSLRDATTGCFTRAHAMDVIDAELRRARRSQLPISVVLFELDLFKEVNDRYGQLCGQAVLASVGERMRAVLRGSDLKCRYGAETFLVLLPETPLHGARRVAETLRREIGDRPIPWAGEALTTTASFGITQALPSEVNIQALIGRAESALARAKEEGRNCVRITSDTLTIVASDRKPHLA